MKVYFAFDLSLITPEITPLGMFATLEQAKAKCERYVDGMCEIQEGTVLTFENVIFCSGKVWELNSGVSEPNSRLLIVEDVLNQ